VKRLRLNSKLGKATARFRSLGAKSRDLQLPLTGLSTKPSELPVGCGPVLGHRRKGYATPATSARGEKPVPEQKPSPGRGVNPPAA
jgi:hypothetical protein